MRNRILVCCRIVLPVILLVLLGCRAWAAVIPVDDGGGTEPEEKVIYLTFDDGPCCGTMRLLEILDRYDAKATFFVVDTGCYDVLREIVKRGHSVGVHSASHVFREIYASEDAYFRDLERMREVIFWETGVETELVRFPGGSSNTVSRFNPGIMSRLTRAVLERGYQYFDWNVDSNDAGGANTTEQVYRNIIRGIQGKKKAVVLQHDTRSYSVAAVERVLIWGRENGYVFRSLTADALVCHHGVSN